MSQDPARVRIQRRMRTTSFAASLVPVALAACACGAPASESPPPSLAVPTAPVPPRYEVHEWGLVRGTAADHLGISGPHAPEPVMVVTKPLLYFHRLDAGDAPLVVDVAVTITEGRVVEHWPMTGPAASHIAWNDVTVGHGSCGGGRYPTLADEPCRSLRDGCEAATLASVETHDADCLTWPMPPGGDGPTEAWNHLFYRGERDTAAPMPLHLAPQADGTLRITSSASGPIPGRLIRLHHANGVAGAFEGIAIADPPAPGATIVMPPPSAPMSAGAEALAASLSAAGLSAEEVASFRRAWDEPLFGPSAFAAAVTTRSPQVVTATTAPLPPRATQTLLYVLPRASADAIAQLEITPAPERLERAIVLWIDESSAP